MNFSVSCKADEGLQLCKTSQSSTMPEMVAYVERQLRNYVCSFGAKTAAFNGQMEVYLPGIIVSITIGCWAGFLSDYLLQTSHFSSYLEYGRIVGGPVLAVALVRGRVGSTAAVVVGVEGQTGTLTADDLSVFNVLELGRTDTRVVEILDTASGSLTVVSA